MTAEQLDTLAKRMWKEQREESDPVLKAIYGLVRLQAIHLRSGIGAEDLRGELIRSLDRLSTELSRRDTE